MRGARLTLILLAASVWLAGCTLPKVPYDRAAAGDIRTIGLVTPAFPSSANIVLASSVGQSFGLVGALIDAAMQADRDAKFSDLTQREKFEIQSHFAEVLGEALRERGYAVAPVAFQRRDTDFIQKFPSQGEARVDAYLDVIVDQYGYVAAGIASGTPYRPHFHLRARLVRAADDSVLMQDAVVYNPVHPMAARSGAVTLAPDVAINFTRFEAMLAAPSAAIDGLRRASEQSAKSLAQILK